MGLATLDAQVSSIMDTSDGLPLTFTSWLTSSQALSLTAASKPKVKSTDALRDKSSLAPPCNEPI